jgi:phosphatidylserine decarboxylase
MSFATAASGQAGAAEDGGDGDGSGQLTAADFEGGSLAIFRLAPQDYHRWAFAGLPG